MEKKLKENKITNYIVEVINNSKKNQLVNQLNLYAVTDSMWTRENRTLANQVKEAIENGVTMIQYREKNLSQDEKKEEAKELLDICHKKSIPFLIDDDVYLAKEIDADGVHLGQKDMSPVKARQILGADKIIGVTAKTVEQALKAQSEGANYLGCGAAFVTSTKKDTYVISHNVLKEICSKVSIPVVAIGGINEKNGMNLIGTGICGIAVVGAIFASENIAESVKKLKNITKQFMRKTKTVLTIAGSDSSGGAGIQADLKTMNANKVYGMSAITAITAQNTTGVSMINNVAPELLDAQLESIFTDIYPDSIKIGMISDKEQVRIISEKLKKYEAKNIVLDPVMVATSGANLSEDETINEAKKLLYPLATVITPNIPEAEILAEQEIKNSCDMEKAAEIIANKYGCSVLLKGGHCVNDANDFLCEISGTESKTSDDIVSKKSCKTQYQFKKNWINGDRINNQNTHGTGCTLSSAIASNLAKGYDLKNSIIHAKKYIEKAIGANLDLGEGSGPMAHFVTEL